MSEKIDPNKLSAAMMTTEDGVDLPSGVRVSSLTGNLIALGQGDVFTLSIEISADHSLQDVADSVNGLKQQMRSKMVAPIRRASQHHGQRFRMESNVVMYPSGRVFGQVIVTCVDAGSDDYDPALADDDEV